MSQKADTLFDSCTSTGCYRMEGVVLVLIQWFIETGGLDDLENIADNTNFESIAVKADHTVGDLILKHRDYMNDILEDIRLNTAMSLIMAIARTPDNTEIFDRMFSYRLSCSIGHKLFDGWWKRNEKNIKKARDNFKSVKMVMES